MQTTVSPRESQRVLPDGSSVRAFILKIRDAAIEHHCRQQLGLHPCTREAAEVDAGASDRAPQPSRR